MEDATKASTMDSGRTTTTYINKVIYGTEVLIDLTGDTVVADKWSTYHWYLRFRCKHTGCYSDSSRTSFRKDSLCTRYKDYRYDAEQRRGHR